MTITEFRNDKIRFENLIKDLCMDWQTATGVEIDSIDIIKGTFPVDDDEDGETFVETSEISQVNITIII